MLLLLALSGCLYHVNDVMDTEKEVETVVMLEYLPGEFETCLNGFHDFGKFRITVHTKDDISVDIHGITVLAERRDHDEDLAFKATLVNDFFGTCGLHLPEDPVPIFRAERPGVGAIGLRGSLTGLRNASVTELTMLCELRPNLTDRSTDLAIEAPSRSGFLVRATRDDGTLVAVKYQVARYNFDPPLPTPPEVLSTPRWAVHYH